MSDFLMTVFRIRFLLKSYYEQIPYRNNNDLSRNSLKTSELAANLRAEFAIYIMHSAQLLVYPRLCPGDLRSKRLGRGTAVTVPPRHRTRVIKYLPKIFAEMFREFAQRA